MGRQEDTTAVPVQETRWQCSNSFQIMKASYFSREQVQERVQVILQAALHPKEVVMPLVLCFLHAAVDYDSL